MSRAISLALLVLALTIVATPAMSKDAYYQVRFDELTITSGELPSEEEERNVPWRLARALHPEVRVEGDAEAYLDGEIRYWNWNLDIRDRGVLHVRAPAGKDVVGELRIPHLAIGNLGQERLRFRIQAKLAGDYKTSFRAARPRTPASRPGTGSCPWTAAAGTGEPCSAAKARR